MQVNDSNLKDLEYPIWIVCSESHGHFTVLFNFSHQKETSSALLKYYYT